MITSVSNTVISHERKMLVRSLERGWIWNQIVKYVLLVKIHKIMIKSFPRMFIKTISTIYNIDIYGGFFLLNN